MIYLLYIIVTIVGGIIGTVGTHALLKYTGLGKKWFPYIYLPPSEWKQSILCNIIAEIIDKQKSALT